MVALGMVGNLRRAASMMSLTQPGVTRILQELESTLGAQLFHRSHTGLTPTTFGLAVIRRARGVLSDLQNINDEVDALRLGMVGHLRVGTIVSLAPTILPRAVAILKQESPSLRIEIREGDNDTLLSELRAGEIQMMLGRVVADQSAADMRRELLYSESFCIVCGERHPLADVKEPIPLARLISWPWIIPTESAPIRHHLETEFALAGHDPPVNMIESASIITNLSLLGEMPALAVVTRSLAQYFAANGFVRILPAKIDLRSGAGVVYFRHEEDALSGSCYRLLEALRKAAKEVSTV